MNSRLFFCILIMALVATGCVSEFNAHLPPNATQILIIDGAIIENTEALFRISRSFSMDAYGIPDSSFVNDAILTLIGSNGYKSPAAIHQGKGAYRISVGKLEEDVEYGIEIIYNEETYQSALSKPLHTPEIDSVTWVQPEKKGAVSFQVYTHDDITESKFYAWHYSEDWEIEAEIPTRIFLDWAGLDFFTTNSAPNYYCWKKSETDGFVFGTTESLKENRIVHQPLYQCAASDERFSILYSVTVTQKTISKGAYEYYQNRKKMNEEMGGLFTPQPSELAGNIQCVTNPSKKVIGYVETHKNISQKRTFVHWYQITRDWPNRDCPTILHKDMASHFGPNMTFSDYYKMGMRPAGDADPVYYPDIIPARWASVYCTDCTANGGSKSKPVFWPNNHE